MSCKCGIYGRKKDDHCTNHQYKKDAVEKNDKKSVITH